MPPRRISFASVLFLTGLTTVSAHAETIQIVMQNVGFAPAQISAKVGDTIEWVNKDILAHTATARNGDWNVMIAPKATQRVTLKKAGSVDYFCKFHPNMTGQIVIAP